MRQEPRAFKNFRWFVSLVGVSIFIAAAANVGLHSTEWLELLSFFLLILVSELLPIRVPGADSVVTMTMPAAFGLLMSHGVAAAIVVEGVAVLLANFAMLCRKRPIRWLLPLLIYNMGLDLISMGVASGAYWLAGGQMLAKGSDASSVMMPLVLWVICYTTTNTLAFTTGLSLNIREPWRVLAAQNLRFTIPNYLVTGPCGILFAYLYVAYGVPGILLVIVPILVGRQALHQYSVQIDAYRETVTSLGSYMQHYHPYTKGHLERVADLSDKVAKQMGLPFQSLMFIREAGLLHDIGKVGVSEDILDKVSKLSDDEWNTIKQHPARGAEILSQMKYLERIVPWVRGHHERPDGRGYPDGLKNEEIPVEAAVIAVADAFDAMTGGPEEKDQRVYRVPLTLDQAMAQVRYGAGTQFDPRVVKAFMKVMDIEDAENGR